MKDIIKKYAELKIAIKQLEEEASALNLEVLQYMQDNELEEVEIADMGKITLGSRRAWKYTDAVNSIEKTLKEEKKKEEQLGLAQYSESVYPIFKAMRHE